jgi:hypothetical protein
MSISKIKAALEIKLNSISPTIATEYENVSFTPQSGVPYQTLNLMPALNEIMFINEASYKSIGIFQITLKYPINQGTSVIMTRADLYLTNFKANTKLIKDGITVKVMDAPDVRVLGVVGDRYVVVLSVNYRAYI